MRRKLYIAYGSNLNKGQMERRCPTARYVGTGMVEGYELKFKGRPEGAYATIDPKKGGRVPVAIWEIQPYDEFRLHQYEGYPNHYFTRNIPVKIGNHEVTGMVYIMNLRAQANLPSKHSYEKIKSSSDVKRILSTAEPLGFDMVVSSLTVGCVRLEAVLYQQSGRKKLGYDLFVKDTPTGQEWICYDNLTDEVRIGAFNFEHEMFNQRNARGIAF